jgi:hypothetical protein
VRGGAAIEPKYSSACRPNSGASREQCRRHGGEGETVLRLAGSTWLCFKEKNVGGDQVRMYAGIIWVTAAAGSCRTYVGIIAPIRLRASVQEARTRLTHTHTREVQCSSAVRCGRELPCIAVDRSQVNPKPDRFRGRHPG